MVALVQCYGLCVKDDCLIKVPGLAGCVALPHLLQSFKFLDSLPPLQLGKNPTGSAILLATPKFPYVPESIQKKQSPELATL